MNMHQHVKEIVSHSTRVTAAVALYNAGQTIEQIAYRIRWSPPSMAHYILECSTKIGELTNAAIQGTCII